MRKNFGLPREVPFSGTKWGFAPAAVLVLLLLVAGLGLAVTRVTDLRNVFQKPKAEGLGKTCSVSLSSSAITPGQSSTVTGNGAKFISRTDSGSISSFGDPVHTDGQGHRYYTLTGSTLAGLTEGNYKVWCGVGNCSGNPFCNYKGGSLTAECSGFVSCSGSDNATLTVSGGSGKSCSVSLDKSSVTTDQSVTVTSSGSGGTVTNYVSRTDSATLSNLGSPAWTDTQGHHYYRFTGNSLSGLTAGSYKVWCGIDATPGPCAGNPFCTYEGGTIDCSSAGYVSCSNYDNVSLTVTATTANGDCVTQTAEMGCGFNGNAWCAVGTTCNTGKVSGPAVSVSCPGGSRLVNTGTYCEYPDGAQKSFSGATNCVRTIIANHPQKQRCAGLTPTE